MGKRAAGNVNGKTSEIDPTYNKEISIQNNQPTWLKVKEEYLVWPAASLHITKTESII